MIGPITIDNIPFNTMDSPVAAGSFSKLTYLGMINDWKTALEPLHKPKRIETAYMIKTLLS